MSRRMSWWNAISGGRFIGPFTFRYELLFLRNVSLRLRIWELPSSIEDFFVRAIETHNVVPTLHDWQTVSCLTIAAAELNRHRAVGVLLRRDVVERVRVVCVRLEIALGVVETDRSATIDGDVLHNQLVIPRAIVLGGLDVEVNGILIGGEAPG